MNASQLKAAIEAAGHERYFFARDTMRFFGDRMRNYGVRPATVHTRAGMVEVWELYRRRPVKHGRQDSAYFTRDTFERVFPVGVQP